MKLREPVAIVAPVRTPVGKLGGALAGIEPYVLLGNAIRGAVFHAYDASAEFQAVLESGKRDREPSAGSMPLDTRERRALKDVINADEVIVGCVRNGIGNVARVGALDAGIPMTVPAMTVDRQCASSLEALSIAAARINAGLAKKIIVAGVESASQAPWLFEKTARPYSYFEPKPHRIRMATEEVGDPPMGETAEILADEFGITREEMDEFAFDSHMKAARAQAEGRFEKEMWTLGKDAQGRMVPMDGRDECVRPDTTLEKLAKLPAVFRKGGRVTAGNSSPLNDAAAACFVMSAETAKHDRYAVDAWIKGISTVALDPNRMGLGPAFAIPDLLKSCGLKMADIDLFEINEAFAAQVLAVLREMKKDGNALPPEKLNVGGGAIAIGHPLGASGLRIVVTLVRALQARRLRRGVASLCVGGGQGMAVLVELP